MNSNGTDKAQLHPLPLPTPIPPKAIAPPSNHWVVRGLDALIHRRMPQSLQRTIDRSMKAMGFRYRRVNADGFRLTIRRGAHWDENAVGRIVVDGDYQRPGFEIRESDTVIDIGANIGCFAVVAGRAARKGRVLAFEPDLQNHHLASLNARNNRLDNVTVERLAIAGKPGTLRLYHGAHGPLHSILTNRVNGDFEEVSAITLEDIFNRYSLARCHMLKMNCEGAEYDILYSTSKDVLARIDRIALEYHASPGQDKSQVSRELAGFLQQNGFELTEFSDFIGFDCGYIRGIRR